MKTTKSQAKQLLTHVPAEGLVLDLYSASDDTLVGRMSPGSAVADMELPADLDAACTGEDEWRFLANTELGEMFLDMWSAGELA